MGKFKNKKSSASRDENVEEPQNQEKSVVDDDTDEEEEEEAVPKWYGQFPLKPPTQEVPSIEDLTSLRIEAQNILDSEAKFYVSKMMKKKKGSNTAWMKTVMAKGTAKDRVAANIIAIQNSPVHSLSSLNSLVSSVKAAKKKECILIMETLCDLFVEDLLRAGVKLRPFSKQPLTNLDEITSGCSRSRRQWMAAWMYEDKLKETYANFIEAVNVVAKDTVDTNRIKAVTTLNKLLTSHPEQEQVLLQHIINKLGDPSQKVVSKVIYCLTQLLRIHPNMKQTVLNEVEKLLFRPHISQRAQYYSVCFLSQFVFSDKDRALAKNIIDIYFSFFKALIKKSCLGLLVKWRTYHALKDLGQHGPCGGSKADVHQLIDKVRSLGADHFEGEVDSRMMGALLMGVKRAYPFAKLDEGSLSQHVDTLYKLVHLSKFNVALHALCLLHEVSGANQDRYYSALYKKLLDPAIGKSCHHAMLVNLLYKSLSKDNNAERVQAIFKRLFQLCFYFPIPVVCALLYMISQLIAKRKKLLFSDTLTPLIDPLKNLDDDDGEEIYLDVDKTEELEQNSSAMENADESVVKEEPEEDEKKPLRGWVHYEFNKNSWKSQNKFYDPFHRNPAFAKAEKSAYIEIAELIRHFHPTVALFMSRILNQETIKYNGDPLADFTLSRFLERFVFKNPKNLDQSEKKGPDPLLASRKYYQPKGVRSLNVRSAFYLEREEKDIPVDELFLYRYLKEKHERRKEVEEDDDNDSVASEEFEEMLDRMAGGKKEFNYLEEIGDSLKKPKTVKGKAPDEEGNESGSEESDYGEFEGDEDMSDIEVDDEDEDDDEVLDFDDEGDFDGDIDLKEAFNDQLGGRGRKRKGEVEAKPSKKRKDGLEGLFAPAEEFAEILEEAGSSKQKLGMHSSLSNKDNAAPRQLDWEKKRDMWVHERGTFKKKFKTKGKLGKKNKQSFSKKKR